MAHSAPARSSAAGATTVNQSTVGRSTRRVKAAAMLRLVAAFAACIGACARNPRAVPELTVAAPFLAVRLAFQDSAMGRERARYGDTTVFLASEALLSDRDIVSVRTTAQPNGGLLLRVRYRPEAAARLAEATGGHVDDQLAVLLDSRVWSLARIAGRIGRGDSLLIATSATGADADRLNLRIRSIWPPP